MKREGGLNNDFVSSFKGFQPGRDVSGFDEYLLLHRKQADHMVAVCLLLVSLNVFQLMRNCRVTSLISLPSRTTKSRKCQFWSTVGILNDIFGVEDGWYFTEASADCNQKLSVLLSFTHWIPSQIHLQQLGPVCEDILQVLKMQKQTQTISVCSYWGCQYRTSKEGF